MESVRNGYESLGVSGYYELHSLDYKNPKESIIQSLLSYLESHYDLGTSVLDLCCGSGEVSKSLSKSYNLLGVDPYTYDYYRLETGNECLCFDFKDISNGLLNEYLISNHIKIDTIICSFALHLCDNSYLPNVLWNLSLFCHRLVIITPNKRPDCCMLGWSLLEEYVEDRVRLRVYHHEY